MRATFIAIVLVLGRLGECRHDKDMDFHTWKTAHGKWYQSEEEESYRRGIFEDTRAFVNEHNSDPDVTYTLSLNKLADRTEEELSRHLGAQHPLPHLTSHDSGNHEDAYSSSPAFLPATLDWRESGAVTDVKDQADCGSCYTYGAVGPLETRLFLKFKDPAWLLRLSEQHFLDCSSDQGWGNFGCNGGWVEVCYDYLKSYGGLNMNSTYGYTATSGSCKANPGDKNSPIVGYAHVPPSSKDEIPMKTALQNGTLSIYFNVIRDFFYYNGGIYSPKLKCDPRRTNHAMVLVGYTQDCWIVKNSWGTTWGVDGYICIARGRGNLCGILGYGIYPLLA